MTIWDYFKFCREHGADSYVPLVICQDGYSVSIQASEFNYCSPRKNGFWQYGSFELGYPNEEDILIKKYAEYPSCLTDTVYAHVDVEIVDQLINKHRGFDWKSIYLRLQTNKALSQVFDILKEPLRKKLIHQELKHV